MPLFTKKKHETSAPLRNPAVSLFMHKKRGDFILSQQCYSKEHGYTEFGTPIGIPKNEFEGRIVELVREGLRQFHENKYDPNANIDSEEEYMDSLRNYYTVIIVLKMSERSLLITPLKRDGRGQCGEPEDMNELGVDEMDGRLPEVLRKAFGKCR